MARAELDAIAPSHIETCDQVAKVGGRDASSVGRSCELYWIESTRVSWIKTDIISQVLESYDDLLETANVLSELDVALGFAEAADEMGLVRPIVDER